MGLPDDRGMPPQNPFAQRALAVACLLAQEARVFGYPPMDVGARLVSAGELDGCVALVRQAHLAAGEAERLRAECAVDAGAGAGDAEAARTLRREHTRLFAGNPRLVHLEGRFWVTRRTPQSRAKGEAAAVAREYRALGLRNKPDVHVPADHLVSELDFAFYAARAEARAWDADDAASALEWHDLLQAFARQHLGEPACGIARATLERSTSPHLRFYAAILLALAQQLDA